jgi:hypothetical protein
MGTSHCAVEPAARVEAAVLEDMRPVYIEYDWFSIADQCVY